MTAYMPRAKRNDHGTPKPLFRWLNKRYGPFTLDAAATKRNAVVPRYLNSRDDALDDGTRWTLETAYPAIVFCNPPYGEGLDAWVAKAIYEVVLNKNAARVVMLLPAYTDRIWFPRVVTFAAEIIFITGRLKFRGETDGAPMGNMVAVFDPPTAHRARIEARHWRDMQA